MNLLDKYDVKFPEETISKNITRLTNQMWKLIPMKEHEEEWDKQLDTVIIEITGLKEIFLEHPDFLQLLAKLEGLREETISFMLYRKTIFESISLLQSMKNEFIR